MIDRLYCINCKPIDPVRMTCLFYWQLSNWSQNSNELHQAEAARQVSSDYSSQLWSFVVIVEHSLLAVAESASKVRLQEKIRLEKRRGRVNQITLPSGVVIIIGPALFEAGKMKCCCCSLIGCCWTIIIPLVVAVFVTVVADVEVILILPPPPGWALFCSFFFVISFAFSLFVRQRIRPCVQETSLTKIANLTKRI